VFIQQSTSMSSYPVHRSLPPSRRSSSDENLVPGEAQDKPLNPHLICPCREPRGWLLTGAKGLGRGKMPTNTRWEDRA
jgi:hypothetical protein